MPTELKYKKILPIILISFLETIVWGVYTFHLCQVGGFSNAEKLFLVLVGVLLIGLFILCINYLKKKDRSLLIKSEAVYFKLITGAQILLGLFISLFFLIRNFQFSLHPVIQPTLIWINIQLIQILPFLQSQGNNADHDKRTRKGLNHFLILFFLFFVGRMVILLLSNSLLENSEAYSLIDTAIHYARENKLVNLNLPLNTHYAPFTSPGYENLLIIHPPLLDLLNAIIFKVWGIGVTQSLLISYAVFITGVLLAAVFCLKNESVQSAFFPILLALLFPYLNNLAQFGRGDSLVGLFLCTIVLLTTRLLTKIKKKENGVIYSFFNGALLTLAIASHFNGAFIAFFIAIYFYFLIRYKQILWKHLLAGSMGILIVLLCWNLLLNQQSTNLIEVMQHVLQEVMPSLRITNAISSEAKFSNIFYPLYKTTGGWIIIIGNFIYIFSCLYKLITQHKISDRDLILMSAFGSFFLFYGIFVTKYHQQYLMNIIFLLLISAALGFDWILHFLLPQNNNKAIIPISGLIILACGIWIWQPVPFSILSKPNRVYAALRSSLQNLLPEDEKIIIGSELSYILYDYDTINNWVTISERGDHPFIAGEVSQWTYETANITLSEMRSIHEDAGNIAITRDTSSWFQSMSFDGKIWEQSFTKVAIVAAEDHIFPIYYKNSILDKFSAINPESNYFQCTTAGVNIIYGINNPPILEDIYEEQWLSHSQSEKIILLESYFNAHDWFDQPLLEDNLSEMIPIIDAYMQDHLEISAQLLAVYNWDDGKRSATQGIEASLPQILIEQYCHVQ